MRVQTKFDFSDVKKSIKGYKGEVASKCAQIGEACVEYAKETGNYHDVTGNLRNSNTYHASEDGLILENTARYASDVEARGNIVLSSAILLAREELEKTFK